jgi:phosphohistidine phosphatase SixA
MQTRRIYLVLAFVLSQLTLMSSLAPAAQSDDGQLSSAWQALQTGHAVILMRHARAPGTGDPPEFEIGQCATQRNLSDDGRKQAVAIGDVLRANGITTATVLSSEWCRCQETAQLLNFGDPVPAPMINSFFQDRSTEPEQTRELKKSLDQWIAQPSEPRILVTHQVNISALTGQFAGSGDMLIVTVADGNPRVLATISTS